MGGGAQLEVEPSGRGCLVGGCRVTRAELVPVSSNVASFALSLICISPRFLLESPHDMMQPNLPSGVAT